MLKTIKKYITLWYEYLIPPRCPECNKRKYKKGWNVCPDCMGRLDVF